MTAAAFSRPAIMSLHRIARTLPPKLGQMIDRYIDGVVQDGRDPAKLFRHGAALLNQEFKRADAGDKGTLDALRRDGIDMISLASAADAFASAALRLEDERAHTP